MLTGIEKFLFALLVLFSLVATYYTFSQMVKIWFRGQGQLSYDHAGRRIWDGIYALFSQGRILRRRKLASIFHFGVAWGFIFYGLVNILDVAEALITGFHFPDNIIIDIYNLLADLFSVAVLLGIVYFFLRRFAQKDRHLTIRENVLVHPKARDQNGVNRDSLIVIIFIFIHVGSRLLGSAFLNAAEGLDGWEPFASLIASPMTGMPEKTLMFGWHVTFWLAVGLVLLFLPYFPYTKHIHLMVGPFNFMTNPERNYLGQMFTLDFEDESIEQFGANDVFDLPQTQIVDSFACIMCNRCQDACPAYNTGKELSPAAIEVNKRYYFRENKAVLSAGGSMNGSSGEGAGLPLMGTILSESAVWACTACGGCIEACPVGNSPMQDIMDIRRDQVLMASTFPDELKVAFVGMERTGNPWQSTDSRMAWAEPLPFEVPTVEENPDYEYLLWVGCAGAFNPDSQEVVRAVATILNAAGVSFAVLGESETCTGDSARRAGNEYLFYEMALGNIETLNAAGADKKKILTSCPHCFTTIGKEYEELGGNYTVFHHTQVIADLVGKGKLTLNGNVLQKTTFHDPCYLGRHNGVLEAPRDALAKAGATLLEMDRTKKNSFCCGAGGAQMWKEEEHGTEAVSLNRFKEAHETGAETLAVGCPFCMTMMKDANTEEGGPMVVKDVAQIVAEALQ
ncbi:MAG: [Fe-S]-binding protein [Chloroflexi bacterium]|nr:MAG: [Fe-S]-binding protein [Chloroflexota bacterium]